MGRFRIFLALGLLGSVVAGPMAPRFAVAHDTKAHKAAIKTPAAVEASALLSSSDAFWTRNALKIGKLGQWETAGKFAKKIADPLARKIIQWHRLREQGVGAGFAEITTFLEQNPDWPDRRRLRMRAEEVMPAAMTPRQVVDWFADAEPRTGDGWLRLGEAHIALGDQDLGHRVLRQAWVERNFTKNAAKTLAKRYKKILTAEDHRRRLDRLLWQGKHWPAQRMLYKVDAGWRALAMARMSLRRGYGNVDSLISKVPKEQAGNLGLTYERLRWRRRKNKKNAAELLNDLPDVTPYPEKWWDERQVLARRALAAGHISEAYRMASKHGLAEDGADLAEAEWLSGWIALRFLKDYDVAHKHFARMYKAVQYPISLARGAYWSGRAAEDAGDNAVSVAWYEKAAAYPTAYYGQLAFARLNPNASLPAPAIFAADTEEFAAFSKHELVRVVRMLGAAKVDDAIRPFILRLHDLTESPGWSTLTAQLARVNGRPDLAIAVAKRASRVGDPASGLGYPMLAPPELPKTTTAKRPEAPLTLAVIRQESAFRVNAKSRAKARGLMQLMPATAKKVAKGLNLHYSSARLMSDANYNMTLGQSYLAGMIDRFDGSYVLALAAYNAGPHRARRWIKDNGDPRERGIDAIDWIEMIPFRETRNYVQRVLENLQIYRSKLAGTEIALGLENDLHH